MSHTSIGMSIPVAAVTVVSRPITREFPGFTSFRGCLPRNSSLDVRRFTRRQFSCGSSRYRSGFRSRLGYRGNDGRRRGRMAGNNRLYSNNRSLRSFPGGSASNDFSSPSGQFGNGNMQKFLLQTLFLLSKIGTHGENAYAEHTSNS